MCEIQTKLLVETIAHWKRNIQRPLLEGNTISYDASVDLVWNKPLTPPAEYGIFTEYLEVNIGRERCPLCREYIKNLNCKGCPISAKGYKFICGQPDSLFYKFNLNLNLESCDAMIVFMESLLVEKI